MANRTVSVNLVANVGQYVSGINTAAAATVRLGETATASGKKAQSGYDLAGKGALLMGAAVVGGFAMAISRSADFEQAMSRVQAATRASAGDMGDLRAAAMKAGADTAFSAGEAAQAITEMAKAGVSTANILNGGLNGALALAAAGELEVGKAAEIAAVAMTQFGLSGDQIPHVADLLAAGAGKAMGSVEDLGAALNQSGLIAEAAGLSIEETTAGLAAFASAGLVGSDAGTSFKTMLQALQAPSGKASELMAELGLNMYDSQGNMLGLADIAGQLQSKLGGLTEEQRNSALATIFGSDAVRAANVLYREGSSGIDEWTAKVNDAGYAAEEAAIKQDNLKGDLEKLSGAFDTLLITLGEGAQGPLRQVVQAFTGILDIAGDLLSFWNSLPGPVQAAVAAIGAFAALRGPMSLLFEKIAVGITSTVTGMGMATGATSGLSLAAGTARVAVAGLVSAAAGLATAFVLTKAITDIVQFSQAGDDARAMVDALDSSLDGLDGPARLQATQGAIGQLRDEMEKHQAVIDEYESYNAVEWTLWGQFAMDADEVANAKNSLEILQAQIDAFKNGGETAGTWGGQIVAAVAGVGNSMTGAANATVAAAETASQAHTDWLTSLQETAASFIEPLGAYTGLLEEKKEADRLAAEATAAGTESSKDSWRDYVTDVTVTFEEYKTRLQEQVTAQENWQTNMLILAGRVSQGTLDELRRMGPEGAPLVADLVNQSDAELAVMDDLFARRSAEATGAWAAQLTAAGPVLAAVGKLAGQGVVNELAAQLRAGTITVAQIAAQYGISLAGGINPILKGLGKPVVPYYNPATGARNVTGTQLWSGGYTGDGGKFEPKGVVHGGEYVLTKEQTARLGIERIEEFANNGYATGGFVTAADVPRPRSTAPYGAPISTAGDATMQKGYDETVAWMAAQAAAAATSGSGPLGTGSVSGGWASIFNWVKARVPQARANSTFRPGDPGYHGRGKAVDFGFGSGPGGAGSAGLALINRTLHDGLGSNLAELIYDGIGDDRPDLKNGRPLTYNAATRAAHKNHVHAAVYDQGGPLQPGLTLAYNGTGKTEWVSREFSGGGAGGPAVHVAAPDLSGMRISGTLMVNGLEARMVGVVEQAVDSLASGLAARGVRA